MRKVTCVLLLLVNISHIDDLFSSPVSTKASEELWYQRAVNYHTKHPDSFVISTPLYPDIKHLPSYPVTASHAIYKEAGGRKALAAVVGVQMDFEKFATRFMEATNIFKVTNL